MRTKVLRFIEQYDMFRNKDTVVIGVSGGADSVCLLFLLCEFVSKGQIDIKNIEVVHVNHCLRDTAKRDEDFVTELCKSLGKRYGISLACHTASADIMKLSKSMGISTEEAGRYVRYDAMRKVLGDRAGVIAVAHHANDRAETMLFNLFRGSGLKGLTGIAPVNGDVVRPLLSVTRKEIEEFLKDEGLSYVTDETNLTDDYTRNKIRHNIIDYATENISSSTVANMNGAINQLYMAEDFISEYTLKAALRCTAVKEGGKIIINLDNLLKEHPYIIDRVLYEAVSYAAGKKKDITSEHISKIRAILEAGGSKSVNLIYGVMVRKEYNVLTIMKEASEGEGSLKESFNLGEVNMRVLESFSMQDIPKDTYTKWFDYDRITSAATLRTRTEGDYLTVNDKLQHQSLKDYFINEKVLKDMRDKIPLLADGHHIMWVIGKRISENYKVTVNTTRVLEVHYEREEL